MLPKQKSLSFQKIKLEKNTKFTYGTNCIELVDEYTYLGTVFNYNNKFEKAINKQINQARRAMFSLFIKSRKLNLPIDITLELFGQLVLPVLLYGCEIWGFSNISQIEIFYTHFF